MQRTGRTAALCDLLALLIEHQVPLDEAVMLASAGVGSPQLERGGRELAERIRRGQLAGKSPAGFPPLLGWTLVAGSGPQLTATLRRTAQVYRDETIRQSQGLAIYVPLATTACIAVVVVVYAAVTLGPWLVIMQRLASAFPY